MILAVARLCNWHSQTFFKCSAADQSTGHKTCATLDAQKFRNLQFLAKEKSALFMNKFGLEATMLSRIFRSAVLISALSFSAEQVLATNNLAAGEARKHIGEKATVCGVVAGIHKATNSKGTPTFINLDERYPHQVFTILIWGDDLSKFPSAPESWEGKRVCASGTITSYRGVPEIVAKQSEQITLH